MRIVKSHEILWTPKLLQVVMVANENGKVYPHARHFPVQPQSFLDDAMAASVDSRAVWFYYLGLTWSWTA